MRIFSLHGVRAAVAAVVAAGALGGVAVAQQPPAEVIEAGDNFWTPTDVTIDTGETVRWEFDQSNGFHNVASSSDNWSFNSGSPSQDHPAAESDPFTEAGEYTFVCQAHPGTMTGTVTVQEGGGEPTPDPDPDPTPDPDPDPTPDPDPDPDPQPSGPPSGGGSTPPAPSHPPTPPPSVAASADTTRPELSRVRAKALRNRRVRVRFSLTEAASVTVRFKRSGRKRTIRTARVMGHEGRNTIRVRSRAFKRGRRYTVRLRARDALGNRSSLERDRLRIRKKGR